MRTKSLFIAAAALAAGIASSSAQGVYSQNVVGYVNLSLVEGFNLIAPQLDLDGTGTNNTVPTVFGNPSSLPLGSEVYVFNGSTFNTESWNANRAGTATNWASSTGSDLPLNPGVGCWLSIPIGAFGGNTGTVTITGNVLQGALVNNTIPPGGGFALVGSQVPLSGGLQTSLSYTPQPNDQVFLYNGATYNTYSYTINRAGTATNWNPSEPVISVGQGFWLNSATGSPWSNTFSVQ